MLASRPPDPCQQGLRGPQGGQGPGGRDTGCTLERRRAQPRLCHLLSLPGPIPQLWGLYPFLPVRRGGGVCVLSRSQWGLLKLRGDLCGFSSPHFYEPSPSLLPASRSTAPLLPSTPHSCLGGENSLPPTARSGNLLVAASELGGVRPGDEPASAESSAPGPQVGFLGGPHTAPARSITYWICP